MKAVIFTAFLAMLACSVKAQTTLFGGQPQMVYELEHEKEADQSSRGNTVTIYPGINWKDGWINVFELQLSREREVDTATDGSTERSNIHTFGARVRKNVHFTENFGGFFRTLLGRKWQPTGYYTYGYIEPALTYEMKPVSLYAGYRMIRSIDGSSGHDVNLLRMGPGWEINEHHEVEVRWARAWDAVTGNHRSDAYEVEYTYKF